MLSLKEIYLKKFFIIFLLLLMVITAWYILKFSDIYLIVFFVAIFVLDTFLSFKFNKKILDDVDVLNSSLKSLVDKKYDISIQKPICCIEFKKISENIKSISKKLQKRKKQKQNYTKKLKDITKKQSDIISAISHEFKNPISAIIGYAQTIKEDDDLSRNMRIKFLQKVLNNANKISNMIDRLSLAIKLENENIAVKKSTFLLRPVLEDIKETILQKYKDRKVVIECEDTGVTFDKTMFENLLINLVENALKYSEDEVVIRVNRGRLEVIDKGIGIEENDLKRLTEKFFRVNTLSWDNSIGVGLYIVKYILKLHGLELFIESQKGVGSRFWFKIDA